MIMMPIFQLLHFVLFKYVICLISTMKIHFVIIILMYIFLIILNFKKKRIFIFYNQFIIFLKKPNCDSETDKSEIKKFLQNTSVFLLRDNAKQGYINNLKSTDKYKQLYLNETSLKKMLISCMYNGEFCYEQDFEFFQLSEFQKCYRFNAVRYVSGNKTSVKKARRYGKNYGLNIELYIGIPGTCESPFNVREGIVVYVHNNTFNVTSESNGVQLAAGAETNIAIDRTYITHQLAPYSKSPCIQPNNRADYISAGPVNKYIDATFDIFDYYSQETCIFGYF